MSHLPVKFFAPAAALALLFGCSAPQSDAPVETTLRAGPALTDTALAGMYMSRDGKTPEGTKFVACLDNFVERFDTDAEVKKIFGEIAAETDSPIELGNVAFFTDLPRPERYKHLVDQMTEIDGRTESDIFNFDSSGTCVVSPEDCTLLAQDANRVRLYWTTIEHGSLGCFE